MNSNFSLAAMTLAVLVSTKPLGAQFTTANLGGRVVDATGASAPQATATVLNKDTGFTRAGITAADGTFAFPALPIGAYRLTVEKAGFSTYVQEGIRLTVNQVASQQVVLQVGAT